MVEVRNEYERISLILHTITKRLLISNGVPRRITGVYQVLNCENYEYGGLDTRFLKKKKS